MVWDFGEGIIFFGYVVPAFIFGGFSTGMDQSTGPLLHQFFPLKQMLNTKALTMSLVRSVTIGKSRCLGVLGKLRVLREGFSTQDSGGWQISEISWEIFPRW